MFIGRAEHTLDDKGRTSIPAKMLEKSSGQLQFKFNITVGVDGCLAMFPAGDLEKFLSGFSTSGLGMEDRLYLFRELISNIHPVNVEYQNKNRITIPGKLLEKAGLSKGAPVLIIAVGRWIELWNPDRYSEYIKNYKGRGGFDRGGKLFFGSLLGLDSDEKEHTAPAGDGQ
ncbi:MAG: hypothetical protein B6D65_02725 [candidate division Zixibacteria bacterium 4484_93]|nr:MAG: hypothetical protein B6D65_02725 [candidate division Zixibacteria bacterium 4484_93]RKZ34946.1 MAG: hypothetical protein DRQ19_00080 [bacterium]